MKICESLKGFAFADHDSVQIVYGYASGVRDFFAHVVSRDDGAIVAFRTKRVGSVRSRRCGSPDNLWRDGFEVFEHGCEACAELFIGDARGKAMEAIVVVDQRVIAVFQFFAKRCG